MKDFMVVAVTMTCVLLFAVLFYGTVGYAIYKGVDYFNERQCKTDVFRSCYMAKNDEDNCKTVAKEYCEGE